MQHHQNLVERPSGDGARFVIHRALGQFDVPVAKLVPDEMVDGVGGGIEAQFGHGRVDRLHRGDGFGDDPAIDRQRGVRRFAAGRCGDGIGEGVQQLRIRADGEGGQGADGASEHPGRQPAPVFAAGQGRRVLQHEPGATARAHGDGHWPRDAREAPAAHRGRQGAGVGQVLEQPLVAGVRGARGEHHRRAPRREAKRAARKAAAEARAQAGDDPVQAAIERAKAKKAQQEEFKKIKIKDSERSLISETVSIEGTINSSGAIDIAGLVKGPVFSKEIIIDFPV